MSVRRRAAHAAAGIAWGALLASCSPIFRFEIVQPTAQAGADAEQWQAWSEKLTAWQASVNDDLLRHEREIADLKLHLQDMKGGTDAPR